MRTIKLDASSWKKPLDFYDALLLALEAPHWHGRGIDPLIDSMVYGRINGIEPPYRILIFNSRGLSRETRAEMDLAIQCLDEAQGIEKEFKFEFQIDL